MAESLPVNGCYLSPLGPLGICVGPGGLRAIRFLEQVRVDRPDQGARVYEALLADYFRDPVSVTLKLNGYQPQGTAFQRRVWEALCEIPVGQVRRYGELAARLDSGARAIGNACRANPIPILIPCHRVVAVHGLGGYMGRGSGHLARKAWLLAHERRH